MNLSSNFQLEELVSPEFISVLGNRAALLLNPQLVPTLQALRDTLGTPLKVNDWHIGGNYSNSGLRTLHCVEGAKRSMHKCGCAADIKSSLSPEKVYFHILNNQEKYPYISRMENIEHTPTWLHIETSSDKRVGDIRIFNPK